MKCEHNVMFGLIKYLSLYIQWLNNLSRHALASEKLRTINEVNMNREGIEIAYFEESVPVFSTKHLW